MEWEDIQGEVFENVACEMTNQGVGLVTLSQDIINRVTEGDDDPKFATFVIESGWSKSNRFWGPELFSEVASEINSATSSEPVVGYMGHIRPENDPYEFPEIQLQWLGARILENGPVTKLAVKAYVLPNTKGKSYLTKGLVKNVSWRGKIAQELYQKGVRVKKFAIESIDLSRPRAAGMSARMVGVLTSEMENDEGGKVKPEEIAALQENELRAHNPGLVVQIEDSVKKPLTEKVSEMEAAADATVPALALIPDLRKLLGLDENADEVTVVQATIAKLREAGTSLRDSVLNAVLDKKLKGDSKEARIARQLIVGEMKSTDFSLSGNPENDEKTISEMVDSIIDTSSELKEIVSEMENLPPSLPTTGEDRNSSREIKPGYSNSNIRVRSAV